MYPTQEELEAIAVSAGSRNFTVHSVIKDFARRIIDWRDAQLRKQEPVRVKHIRFDYLDNGQLVATYYLPVSEKEAPPLYAAPVPAPAVPEGWQIVPVEPTEEMLWALYRSFVGGLTGPNYESYRAMLSAAPKAPAVATAPSDDAKDAALKLAREALESAKSRKSSALHSVFVGTINKALAAIDAALKGGE